MQPHITWIQAWWSPFFAWSSRNEYTVVHSQFYLTFITIYHLPPEIIYSFVPIQFTPCQPLLTLLSRLLMLFFYNTHVIFCFVQFSLNSLIGYRSSPLLIDNFLEWSRLLRTSGVLSTSSIRSVL